MNALLLDLRYSVRMLRQSPSFAAAAILTLALGIGGNTAIFGLLNALVLRPMPVVAAPEQLAWVFSTPSYELFSYPDYADLREQTSGAFAALAAFQPTFLSMAQGQEVTRVRGEAVSDNYFSVLGVRPALGAPISAPVGRSEPQVVLGDALWRERFGGDPAVIGRSLQINGFPFLVIGVAPPGFAGTQTGFRTDLWVPLAAQEQAVPALSTWKPLTTRAYRWLEVMGRLRDGAPLPRAQVTAAAVARRLAAAFPGSNRGFDHPVVLSADGGDPLLRRNQLPLLALLMSVVTLVLLIACANVANLLLTRALVRSGEMSLRQALGASRARLLRQVLVESVLLALLGGALGLFLAAPLGRLLLSFLPAEIGPVAIDLQLDHRVLAFTLLASLLTGCLFGLAPAFSVSSRSLLLALRGVTTGGRSGGRRGMRLRAALVVSQVALSLVLLVGAGLLLRTLQNQQSADPGFNSDNVLLLDFDLSLRGYTAAAGESFQRQLRQRLGALPGVRVASLSTLAPLGLDTARLSMAPAGHLPGPGQPPLNALISCVSPDFLRTLGIPLLHGRDFSSADGANAPRVAIVNQELAARLWPGEEAVGKRLSFPAPPLPGSATARLLEPDATVIGVARNSKYTSLGERPQPFLYLALSQKYDPATILFVRTEAAAMSLVESVRRELRSLDPYLPVYQIRSLRQQVGASLWSVRLTAALCALFGAFALLLAAVGIYSVLSQSVAQRTHEIGVRMAVGAQRSDVFGLIIRQSLKLTLIGVALGVLIALGLARTLSRFLIGVSTADPLTFAAIALLLIAVSWLAAYLPARRAVRVDPVAALRAE